MRTRGSSAAPHVIGRPRLAGGALVIALVAMVLTSCGAGSGDAPASSSAAPGSSTAAFAAAADGLCVATAALPDRAATKRAFVNDAHDAIHALAADPQVTRAAAARILEAMDQIERDFDASAEARELSTDLAALTAATSAALVELGIEVPLCGT
ncbi:MAG: hypothetical protein ABI573_11875 [Chloroflexota bacterium]